MGATHPQHPHGARNRHFITEFALLFIAPTSFIVLLSHPSQQE